MLLDFYNAVHSPEPQKKCEATILPFRHLKVIRQKKTNQIIRLYYWISEAFPDITNLWKAVARLRQQTELEVAQHRGGTLVGWLRRIPDSNKLGESIIYRPRIGLFHWKDIGEALYPRHGGATKL